MKLHIANTLLFAIGSAASALSSPSSNIDIARVNSVDDTTMMDFDSNLEDTQTDTEDDFNKRMLRKKGKKKPDKVPWQQDPPSKSCADPEQILSHLSFPIQTCFWGPPVSYDPLWNYVYADSNAVYMCASFDLPEGTKLTFSAEYPRSRYMSWTVYGTDTDSLIDIDIEPNEGSLNPFIPGVNRDVSSRSYNITIVQGNKPNCTEVDCPPNTLYTSDKVPMTPPPYVFEGNTMCVRVYVPDRGQYPFGGVTLPDVALVQDGTTYSGKEMCSKINANNQDNGSYGITPVPPNFNLNKYIQLRQEGNGTDSTPPTWPARNPAIFRAYFNNVYQQCIVFTNGTDCNPSCTMDTDCASAPGAPFCIEGKCSPVYNPAGVGLGNPSNRYLETYFDKGLGDIFVLRAKMPTTPKTFDGEKFIKPYEEYDMRYFSICPQESLATWRVGKCLYDQDIPVDDEGYYTVVISGLSSKPKNAIKECGVAWTFSPPAGDGAGDINLSDMWIRNMLPSSNFTFAAQNIRVSGTEEEVMGEYYPVGTYYETKEDFEELGCPPFE